MSYLMYRDNADLTGIDDYDDRVAICSLSEVIDTSSQRGSHEDACACDGGESCVSWRDYEAGSEETIAWLVAKGVLTMSMVHEALTGHLR